MGLYFQNFFQTGRFTLRINDFIPIVSGLFSRMITQCGNRATLTKKLKKFFYNCPVITQLFFKNLVNLMKKKMLA